MLLASVPRSMNAAGTAHACPLQRAVTFWNISQPSFFSARIAYVMEVAMDSGLVVVEVATSQLVFFKGKPLSNDCLLLNSNSIGLWHTHTPEDCPTIFSSPSATPTIHKRRRRRKVQLIRLSVWGWELGFVSGERAAHLGCGDA